MSFGKMTDRLTILKTVHSIDDEGFDNSHTKVVARIRCYHEGRHGSLRCANLAAFSTATDRFVFRRIPNLAMDTDFIFDCNGQRFKPLSVENVRGRGMYIEALAERVIPTDG